MSTGRHIDGLLKIIIQKSFKYYVGIVISLNTYMENVLINLFRGKKDYEQDNDSLSSGLNSFTSSAFRKQIEQTQLPDSSRSTRISRLQ